MTADRVKASLAKAARRAWPNAAKASDLPFPEYWKSVTEWLTFHAPRIGDKLAEQFVIAMVEKAKDAESRGLKPVPWIVPEKVKEIWANAAKARKASKNSEAWDHAAERAQGRLL